MVQERESPDKEYCQVVVYHLLSVIRVEFHHIHFQKREEERIRELTEQSSWHSCRLKP